MPSCYLNLSQFSLKRGEIALLLLSLERVERALLLLRSASASIRVRKLWFRATQPNRERS